MVYPMVAGCGLGLFAFKSRELIGGGHLVAGLSGEGGLCVGVAVFFADGVAHDGSAGSSACGRVETEDGLGCMAASVGCHGSASAYF